MKEQSDTPSWWRCDTHGPGTRTAWGCPECVRELRERLATATRQLDEALVLNAKWAEKAETWTASPEAAQRLQGYRDLAQQVAEAQNERDEARVSVDTLRAAIKTAEAALADIGDSDHEPTDDLAWCERRAQQVLPVVRFALAATEAKP